MALSRPFKQFFIHVGGDNAQGDFPPYRGDHACPPDDLERIRLLSGSAARAPAENLFSSCTQDVIGERRKHPEAQRIEHPAVPIEPGYGDSTQRIKDLPLFGVGIEICPVGGKGRKPQFFHAASEAFAHLPAYFSITLPPESEARQGPLEKSRAVHFVPSKLYRE